MEWLEHKRIFMFQKDLSIAMWEILFSFLKKFTFHWGNIITLYRFHVYNILLLIHYSMEVKSVSRSVASHSLWPHGLARQALLSMGFSRQESWSGLPFPSSGDCPSPGTEPASLRLLQWQVGSFPLMPPGKPYGHVSCFYIMGCCKKCFGQL